MSKDPMTDKEVNDLAKMIYKGEVFTSYNEGMSQQSLPMVFLPLVFMDRESKQRMIDGDVDMLYAPMKAAGPRAINGMPQFFEFNWCSREDTLKVFDKVDAIRSAVEETIGEGNKELSGGDG